MHAQREDRARGEDHPVEIHGDLVRIVNRHERNRGKTADERGAKELDVERAARAPAAMAFSQMAVAMGTGGLSEGSGPRRDRTFDNLVKSQVLYH